MHVQLLAGDACLDRRIEVVRAHGHDTGSGRIAALRAHLSVPRSHEQDTSFAVHQAIVAAFKTGKKAELRRIPTDHILRAQAVYALAVEENAKR
jgi:DNA-binding GntR family transcriptional regulator